MMKRKHAAWAVAALLALSPAAALAQQTGSDINEPTETQQRRSDGTTNEFPWDLLGLLGLAGLLGLRQSGTDRTR